MKYTVGLPMTTIVIHDMEGSFSGTIGWFQNPSSQVSAHYDIRSSDGQVAQQVRDGDTAWHGGNWDVNQHAIGIEHEGHAHTGSQWYTEAMYKSSAALTRWLYDTFHIPQDCTHIIGHQEIPDPNHPGWFGGAGGHHDPCDSWAGSPTWHNVSACEWDWNHYMTLVTGGGLAAIGTLTGFVGDACCGLGTGSRKPLPFATAMLEGTTYSTNTDASGTYSFTIAPGSFKPQTVHVSYALPRTGKGATVTSAMVTVSGAAGVKGPKSILVDHESVDFDPATGAFSVQVILKRGANRIVIDALPADGQILESMVTVTYADASTPSAISKTGCASAGLADLLALVPLAAFLRCRR